MRRSALHGMPAAVASTAPASCLIPARAAGGCVCVCVCVCVGSTVPPSQTKRQIQSGPAVVGSHATAAYAASLAHDGLRTSFARDDRCQRPYMPTRPCDDRAV